VKLNYRVTGGKFSKTQDDLSFASRNVWMQNIARSLYSNLLLPWAARRGGRGGQNASTCPSGGDNPATFKSMSPTTLRCWHGRASPITKNHAVIPLYGGTNKAEPGMKKILASSDHFSN